MESGIKGAIPAFCYAPAGEKGWKILNSAAENTDIIKCLSALGIMLYKYHRAGVSFVFGTDKRYYISVFIDENDTVADVIAKVKDSENKRQNAPEKEAIPVLAAFLCGDFTDECIPVCFSADSSFVSLSYNSEICDTASAEVYLSYYINILKAFDNTDIKVSDISLMNAEQEKAAISMLCGEKKDMSDMKLPFEAFLECAEKYPELPAVFDSYGYITYGELKQYTAEVAAYLVDIGIKRGDTIAVSAVRSVETVVFIMAAAATGACYMPVDTELPEERAAYMLSNSSVSVLMTSKESEADYLDKYVSVISYDFEAEPVRALSDDEMLGRCLKENDYAYVMYTSGTTGKPKGVRIKTFQLRNLCVWFSSMYSMNEKSCIMMLVSLVFDASIRMLYTPFMVGASLIIGPDKLFDTEGILNLADKYGADYIGTVPALIEALAECDRKNNYKTLEKVKYIVMGGDKFDGSVLREFTEKSRFSGIISNMYGPAECTCISTLHYDSLPEIQSGRSVPIGRPAYNKRIYVLDDSGKMCPVGMTGKLFLAGTGTADGYIGDTCSSGKFVPEYGIPDEKMYDTGDNALLRADGELMFMGRSDLQIKIDGRRIEIGEIETALNSVNGIIQSVVVPVEGKNGRKRLAAYYVSDRIISDIELAAAIRNKLPSYMMPSVYVRLEHFPQNRNGKIDRKKLSTLQLEIKDVDV